MPYPAGQLGSPSPLLNSIPLFQHNASFRPASAPVFNSSLNTSRLEVPQLVPTLSSPLHSSSTQQNDLKESSPLKSEQQGAVGGNSSARSGRSLDSGLGSNLNVSSPRTMLLPQEGTTAGATANAAGTSLLPDPFLLPVSSRLPVELGFGAEQNRQLASLLSELDAQRAECKKVCTCIFLMIIFDHLWTWL